MSKHLLKKLSDSELRVLCSKATSLSDLLSKIGYLGGGSFRAVKQRVVECEIDISHFTGKTWNKGLHKKDHASIQKYALTLSKKMLGCHGKKHSSATKHRMSIKRSEFLNSHSNHGVSWHDVPCGDLTLKVQGTWEKRVALWLNANHIAWERKPLKFSRHRCYTPDFFLPEKNYFIEVKGFWRDRDIYKMFLALSENDVDIRIVDKRNIDNLTLELPKFTDVFSRSSIDLTKFKNIWSSDGTVDM